MLELKKGTKILFNYFNPKDGKTEKHIGKVLGESKYKYGYIVSFKKENDTYIDDKKKNKIMYHNYYVNQDNFIEEVEV